MLFFVKIGLNKFHCSMLNSEDFQEVIKKTYINYDHNYNYCLSDRRILRNYDEVSEYLKYHDNLIELFLKRKTEEEKEIDLFKKEIYSYDKNKIYFKKDLKKYFEYFLNIKDKNEEIENIIGICYRYGIGVNKDLEKALYWFKLSAEKKFNRALKNLSEVESEIKDYEKICELIYGNKSSKLVIGELLIFFCDDTIMVIKVLKFFDEIKNIIGQDVENLENISIKPDKLISFENPNLIKRLCNHYFPNEYNVCTQQNNILQEDINQMVLLIPNHNDKINFLKKKKQDISNKLVFLRKKMFKNYADFIIGDKLRELINIFQEKINLINSLIEKLEEKEFNII